MAVALNFLSETAINQESGYETTSEYLKAEALSSIIKLQQYSHLLGEF